MHVAASLKRMGRSLKRVARTHYPGFIFGMPLNRAEVPVFIYHDVDPESFATDLAFLQDNGYRTLTTDEFIKLNGSQSNERTVLLTFDDAPRNFWEVAFPLLRKFDAKVTLFVPTTWIGGASRLHEDNGVERGASDDFITWDQLRVCERSGLVDIQSHAHRHALVYTSTRLVGFASPKLLTHHHLYGWPMRRSRGRDFLGRPALGTPIYEAMPLLSASYRVFEHEEVVQACLEHVAICGGEKFFTNINWSQELHQVHEKAGKREDARRVMDQEQFHSLVESEFSLSRQFFEAELGKPPRYFAYPWMLGSDLSLQLAVDTGIQAVFGVGMDFRRVKSFRGPLPAYSRIKGDWLRFLPGRGRRKLQDVIPEKVKGFLSSQYLAH